MLLLLHVWPVAMERFTTSIWTLRVFIFAGCFELPPPQPNKLARRVQCLECSGGKICSRAWRSWRGRSGAHNNSVICVRTLLVYLALDGYQKFSLGDLEYQKAWSTIPMRHSAEEAFYRWKGIAASKTAAMNTPRWHKHTYFRLLLLHLRELRRPMLDSDCANACAPNRLPGSMRHWFTSFNHSPKQANHWLQRTVG